MRLARLTAPHLRWSYYFSGRGDFLVIYPYASGPAFIRGLGLHSVDDYLAAMYASDVYRLGLAENPGHDGYWTPVYLDADGAGWMVSHAAPVYVGGACGHGRTGVLLDFLSVFLAHWHRPPGRVWIVDDRGELLAVKRPWRTAAFTDLLAGPPCAVPAEIPGIYPPVRLGDRWYVDGGVHPVPIEFVLPLGADYVIAVDLAFPTTSCTANSSRVLPVGTCHAF